MASSTRDGWIAYRGGYTLWGSLSELESWLGQSVRLHNVPRFLGECVWTLCTDNLFTAHPHRVTKLVRLP